MNKEKKLIKQIYHEHLKKTKNLSVPHKKLIICFSGIPGSGKTHMAKILEKRYKAVRTNNDKIRKIIRRLKIDEGDVNVLLDEYLLWFFSNYSFPNKLIILDSSVDRRYKKIFPLFKKKGYTYFIIRIKVLRELSKKRIIKKLGKLDANYINNIDRWIRENKEFNRKVKSSFILENKGELGLKPLFSKLDKLVKS